MKARLSAALVVLALSQVVVAAREPQPQASTYVNTVTDGVKQSTQAFGESLTDEHPADVTGQSYSAVHYPLPGTWNPSGFLSTDAGADAAGVAQMNIPAGQLRVLDQGWINCGADSATYGWVRGYATASLTDIITLDQPARVTILGHVSGSTFGLVNGDYDDASAAIAASFVFWQDVGGEIGWQSVGYKETFRVNFIDTTDVFYGPGIPLPEPSSVYDTVSFSMDLPAGNTYFSAMLDASFNLMVSPGGSANVTMSFQETALFGLYVPEGVTATSASGLLPIATPEPATLSLLAVGLGAMIVRRRGRR